MKEFEVYIEKEYDVSESMVEAPLKPSLTFPIPLKVSDANSLISYLKKLLMRVSNGMKELDGFTFGVKPSEGM